MSVLVVSNLLLLLRDVDSNLDGLGCVSKSSVELESVLRFFRDVIGFTHKIVNKLVGQSIELCLGNHVDHISDAALSLLDVELECFVQLL